MPNKPASSVAVTPSQSQRRAIHTVDQCPTPPRGPLLLLPRPLLPGLAALQTSIIAPELVNGVQCLDISLRGLHIKRQAPLQRPFVAAFQRLLRETQAGQAFFANVATERVRAGAEEWGTGQGSTRAGQGAVPGGRGGRGRGYGRA